MARGVTQEQVNAAIDTLVAAGERPTIERVRATLGTGSPNTVTRMLDAWWAALGNRLEVQQHKVAMANAPAEVSALASQLWEQALLAARAEARNALDAERTQLGADRARMVAERGETQQVLEAQGVAVAIARQAKSLAETRLADAQQLAERQGSQLTDVLRQRDALQARVDQLAEEITTLGARLQKQESDAVVDREAHAHHLRSIENRSHAEIDRARQETKELRTQLSALERERAARELQRDDARNALAAAQRDAAGHQARADQWEQELARLNTLHATLQSALARGSDTTASKRSAQRKQAPAAAKSTAKRTRIKLPARR